MNTTALPRQIVYLVFALFVLASCAKELTDTQLLQQAKETSAKGDFRSALIHLKNALQKNPKNAEARLLLASLYIDSGDGSAAEKELGHASDIGIPELQTAPLLARAWMLQQQHQKIIKALNVSSNFPPSLRAELLAFQAEAAIKLGDAGGAKTFLDQAISIDPQGLRTLMAQARLALVNQDFERSSEFANKAVQKTPKDADALLLQGDTAFARAQYDGAEKAFLQIVKITETKPINSLSAFKARIGLIFSLLAQNKDDQALPYIDTLVKANPQHPTPNYLRGLLAFRKKDYVTAADHLSRSNTAAPDNHSVIALLAATQYALGNMEQTETLLTKHLAAEPSDLQSQKLLAATRLKLKSPDKAIEALDAAIKLAPADADMLAMLGVAATMKGDFSEGRAYLKKASDANPQDTGLRVRLAESYLAEGNEKQALEELDSLSATADGALRAKMLVALSRAKNKDIDGALAIAKELILVHTKNPAPFNLLGSFYLMKKDPVAARKQFETALQLKADFVPAMLSTARLEQQENNLPAARQGFEKILKLQANNVPALMGLAQIEEKESHPDKALALMEQAREANPNALQPRLLLTRYYLHNKQMLKADSLAAEMLKIAPSHPAVLATLGESQTAQRKFSDAAKTYEQLLALQPRNPWVHLSLGEVRAQMGQLDPARKAFKEALKIEPNFQAASIALAILELNNSNIAEAANIAEGIIKRAPKSSEGYILRGDTLARQGKFEAAAQAYADASAIRPSSALTLSRYMALTKAQQQETGLEILRSWLKQNPDDIRIKQALAQAYQELGQHNEAIPLYTQILSSQPDNLIALNNLALSYFATQDPKALATAEKAYNLNNKHPAITDTLGWILVQQGELDRGTRLLEKAREKSPNTPDIAYHLAVALAKSGDKTKARGLLEKALALPAPFSDKTAAETLLKQL